MLDKLNASLDDFAENMNSFVSESSELDTRYAVDKLAHETFNALDLFRDVIEEILEKM